MAEPAAFRFERSGRAPAALWTIAAVLAAALGLVTLVQAHWLVLALALLLCLPALRDAATDRRAGLTLADGRLAWHSGARRDHVSLADVQSARIGRRMDLSTRAVLLLKDGRRVTLPRECLPGPDPLQAAFSAHGLPVEGSGLAPRPPGA